MLLLDAGAITKKDLNQALKLQDINRLANSAIFHSLPKSVIAEIHSKSARLTYEPNEIIFRQQEGSDYVYVILLGTVNLTHKPQHGMNFWPYISNILRHLSLRSGNGSMLCLRVVSRARSTRIIIIVNS